MEAALGENHREKLAQLQGGVRKLSENVHVHVHKITESRRDFKYSRLGAFLTWSGIAFHSIAP